MLMPVTLDTRLSPEKKKKIFYLVIERERNYGVIKESARTLIHFR